MIEGQVVDGLFLLSFARAIDLDIAGQKRGSVLDFSSPLTGGGKIYDMSGKGNHGSISGPTWARLPSGLWVLDFDGVDDQVTAPIAIESSIESFTLKAWVYATLAPVDWERSFFRDNGYSLHLNNTNGVWAFGVWNDPAAQICYGTSALVYSKWVHVVGVYDKGANYSYIYVNGVQENSLAISAGALYASTGTKIGYGVDVNRWFKGRLALIRFYNIVLNDRTIVSHFNQERHLFGV